MPAKKTHKKVRFYLALFLASFLFLSFFSYSTTPFSITDNGKDAGFFRLVGQGMTKGLLPYRDFFDMKGPYLFFVEYLGQLICYGRLGIFIVQWINLIFSVVLICRIFELYQIRKPLTQLVLLLPLAYIAGFSFEGGNLTEEFSLLPLLSCLYVCLLYFKNSENPDKLWQETIFRCAGALFGLCFGFLLMIRVTNAALICAMILTVGIDLIVKRRPRQLFFCAVCFIGGLLLAVVPAILFFAAKGILREMFEAVFVLGFKYSGEKTFLQHVFEAVTGVRKQQLLLLLIPAIMPVLLRWGDWRVRVLAFTGALFTFFAVASGNNFTHYYTLALPLALLCEIAVADSLRAKSVPKTILAVVLSAVMLIPQYSIAGEAHVRAYEFLFHRDARVRNEVRDIASRIPEANAQSVYCYNLDPAWYTYANLFPCIKYCGWQNHYISLMPEIYYELESIFLTNPPLWLVLPADLGELPTFLEEQLKTNYTAVYSNDSYILFYCWGKA